MNNLNGFRTLWEPCKFFYTRVFHLEVESTLTQTDNSTHLTYANFEADLAKLCHQLPISTKKTRADYSTNSTQIKLISVKVYVVYLSQILS